MKVLITGAGGFVGRAVARRLEALGVSWTGFGGDVVRFEDFETYGDCDTVIHLAAKLRDPISAEHLIDVNVHGTINALRFASTGKRRMVFASSYLYGVPAHQPVSEDAPIHFSNVYTFSKWHAEQAVLAWERFFGLSGTILRIFNVFGPGQRTGFLIPDVLDGAMKGSIVLRNLSSRRDFIFVDDLADLIVRAARSPLAGMPVVNAGSGVSHSVQEAVETILDALGRPVGIENLNLVEEVPETLADISRARELFGWRPSTSFREGIDRIVAELAKGRAEEGAGS